MKRQLLKVLLSAKDKNEKKNSQGSYDLASQPTMSLMPHKIIFYRFYSYVTQLRFTVHLESQSNVYATLQDLLLKLDKYFSTS